MSPAVICSQRGIHPEPSRAGSIFTFERRFAHALWAATDKHSAVFAHSSPSLPPCESCGRGEVEIDMALVTTP